MTRTPIYGLFLEKDKKVKKISVKNLFVNTLCYNILINEKKINYI